MIKTAVVILNWNGEAMLRQFLPSVIACSRLEGTEIYVADNASTDASCEVVEKEFPSVHLIRLDKNYGFADGYNYALQKIDAEYAVLLNSDVEVTEGWLQPMVDYLDTHPETVACQPKIRAYRHRNLFEYAGASGGFIDRYGYPFCRASHSHLNSYKPGEKKTKIHIQLLIKLHPQTKIKNPEQTVVHSGDLLKYLQIQIKLLLQLLRKEFLQKLPCEV
jgi:GT2 family glycosyltransferase